MTYLYDKLDELVGQPIVGSGQCVALVQHYANAPASSLWHEGKRVTDSIVKKGTAIATFVDGKYPNGPYGNHAALYHHRDATGIYVVDQWKTSNKIQLRKLKFKGRGSDNKYADPSNNGDAFSVIE